MCIPIGIECVSMCILKRWFRLHFGVCARYRAASNARWPFHQESLKKYFPETAWDMGTWAGERYFPSTLREENGVG